ncbi:hypothetical protein DUI87_00539 [Hirundo rustica rustica]|uniref:RING-type E3 ubiquitin transferase n=1 Tax=Hirundo rustica rustica TaxID=333673 RepID=A0A3M0LA08_HIRRU|nr:hypothetical protein DUI87_00539 [Hirundo rustica rustica]
MQGCSVAKTQSSAEEAARVGEQWPGCQQGRKEKRAQNSWPHEQVVVGPWDWTLVVTVNSPHSKQQLDPPPSDAERESSCPLLHPSSCPQNLTGIKKPITFQCLAEIIMIPGKTMDWRKNSFSIVVGVLTTNCVQYNTMWNDKRLLTDENLWTADDHGLSLLTVCNTSKGEQLLFLSCPQPATTASMATGAEWSCSICRETSSHIAYVGSCLHQFCRGCILRWARKNPSCPLCRQTVHTIIYLAPHQGFVEMSVPQPSVPRSTGPREELGAAEPQPRAHVAGFPPEIWALFFRNHAEILRPLELWPNEVLCGACRWDVAFSQGRIVVSLCRYGLH